jgi:hypothetical protein
MAGVGVREREQRARLGVMQARDVKRHVHAAAVAELGARAGLEVASKEVEGGGG